MTVERIGAVLVVGSGVAGIQAALDLAEGQYRVYLLEEDSVIGGKMPLLARTFPTNECSLCSFSPQLAECVRHPNIQIFTRSRLDELTGVPGRFQAFITMLPRGVDSDKCVACGKCSQVCPVKIPDDYNQNLGTRKAIFQPYAQAYPRTYVLDQAACLRCGRCVRTCPVGAINLDDEEQQATLEVGAVILCPGFQTYDPTALEHLGYGSLANVITSMELERHLSAAGPLGGRLVRPSDGKPPKRVAWVQCVGSRSRALKREYCSAACCMTALKGALAVKEQVEGLEEAEIFYQDMRTYGKGHEYYRQRALKNGIKFSPFQVRQVSARKNNPNELLLCYRSPQGEQEKNFDLLVLSVGMDLPESAKQLMERLQLPLHQGNCPFPIPEGAKTQLKPGVFVAGAFTGPKDIASAVIEAGAAAAEAAALLAGTRGSLSAKVEKRPARDIHKEEPRIGVLVCHCGTNISSVVDVEAVRGKAAVQAGVVVAEELVNACAEDSLRYIQEVISRHNLNRLVIAACSPRSHLILFQRAVADAGLNPSLVEMANIRDHCAWVHSDAKAATEKAHLLVAMAIAKCRLLEPVDDITVAVTPAALVVGDDPAGVAAAVGLAEQGFNVHLVRKASAAEVLPVNACTEQIGETEAIWCLYQKAGKHPLIKVHPTNYVVAVDGHAGKFSSQLSDGQEIKHGVTVLAPQAKESRPTGFLYGEHQAVSTLGEAEENLDRIGEGKTVAMMLCVGSRNEERPYCSRTCCRRALQLVLRFKAQNPGQRIVILYRDISVYGQDEQFYRQAREAGVEFIRYEVGAEPVVSSLSKAELNIEVLEAVTQDKVSLQVGAFVLATATEPAHCNRELASLYKVPTDHDGFFLEAHANLKPLDFSASGVYMCGSGASPKFLRESILEGRAVASRCAGILGKGEIEAQGVYAQVNADKCTACLSCLRVCPFNVPVMAGNASYIEPVQCQGCGICVAECPGEAIHLLGYRKEQLLSLLDAALLEEQYESKS